MLAVIRPDEWNLPLFLHVLGAMALVGSLAAVVAGLLVASRRDRDVPAALARFGFWTLIVLVLPSYILMRIGAEWIESKGVRRSSRGAGLARVRLPRRRPRRAALARRAHPLGHRPLSRPSSGRAAADARPDRRRDRGDPPRRVSRRGLGDDGEAGLVTERPSAVTKRRRDQARTVR
jgi:hypothetical protein